MGPHQGLAVGDFAQRAAPLPPDADGGRPLLGKGRVVQGEQAVGWAARAEVGDPALVEGDGVPVGIGEQVLEALGRGASDGGCDRLAGLARQISEEAGNVTLQALAAPPPAEQVGEWFEVRVQFRQGGRSRLRYSSHHVPMMPRVLTK